MKNPQEPGYARLAVHTLLADAENPTAVLMAILKEVARYTQDELSWVAQDFIDEATDAFDNAELENTRCF